MTIYGNVKNRKSEIFPEQLEELHLKVYIYNTTIKKNIFLIHAFKILVDHIQYLLSILNTFI